VSDTSCSVVDPDGDVHDILATRSLTLVTYKLKEYDAAGTKMPRTALKPVGAIHYRMGHRGVDPQETEGHP
jgi:hypothetical protein